MNFSLFEFRTILLILYSKDDHEVNQQLENIRRNDKHLSLDFECRREGEN